MSRPTPAGSAENGDPLVSVIMNCYNGEKYLGEAVASVLAQTYRNWEIVFWDNQSTDRSAEIFQERPDPRLNYFRAPEHTLLYAARNLAIGRARGAFFAFLDVDDRWLPEKLEKQMALFADPEVGLVCGNFWIEDERNDRRRRCLGGPAPTGWVVDDLLKSYFVGLLTLVIRRSAVEALPYPCDPRYHIIGDFDLVVRLSLRWKLDCVQEPVACYRRHAGAESFKHHDRHIDELQQWLGEAEGSEALGRRPALALVRNHLTYLKAMRGIRGGDRRGASALLADLPAGRLKLKLRLALLLPGPVMRRLKP